MVRAEESQVRLPLKDGYTLGLRRVAYESHDACMVCGNRFVQDDRYWLGYARNDDPMIVGDCCKDVLNKSVVAHGFHVRPFRVPPDDTPLFRYMNLSKFISLLSKEALFFPRMDQLGDPFECAIGLGKHREYYARERFKILVDQARHLSQTAPPGYPTPTAEMAEKNFRSMVTEIERTGDHKRDGLRSSLRTFASCWHENQQESEALWKLYGGTDGNGVAIRTTYRRLRESLLDRLEVGDRYEIDIGRVEYIDYARGFLWWIEAPFRKRKAFEHEREVRAIFRLSRNDPTNLGVHVPVDLFELIESVVVSPLAPLWFSEVVADVMKRYSVRQPVTASDLLIEPLH